MKKFYEEYFHIPKNGKIREKVMLTRVFLTAATMVLCLIAMSITAYAYFSHEASTGSHVIKAANFATKVGIQVVDNNGNVVDTVNPITSNYASHKATLQEGKKYVITIEPLKSETAANTGFVIVKADGCAAVYHTQQLYKDVSVPSGERTSIRFTLTVTEDTDVYFLSHWGTSVHYVDYRDKGENDALYITQDEEIMLKIGTRNEAASVQEDSDTPTTTTTTTTVTTATTTTTTTEEAGENTTTTSSATSTAATTTVTTEVGEDTTTSSFATTTETTTVPTQPDTPPTQAPAPEGTEE